MRIALIGYGNIARAVLQALEREQGVQVTFAGLLVRSPRLSDLSPAFGNGQVVSRISQLLDLGPDVVLDCAGHQALRDYGETILSYGADLITVSSGALCDPNLERALRSAARCSSRRLIVPSGALLGLDGLSAARHGGLDRVVYTGRKPVAAWRGTAAEHVIDLDRLSQPRVFFDGNAREAAAAYPKNANVTATVALAGLGFERTEVRLVADPAGDRNIHELSYEGSFGRARLEVDGNPSPTNFRTSLLTGFSMWQAVLNRAGGAIVVAG